MSVRAWSLLVSFHFTNKKFIENGSDQERVSENDGGSRCFQLTSVVHVNFTSLVIRERHGRGGLELVEADGDDLRRRRKADVRRVFNHIKHLGYPGEPQVPRLWVHVDVVHYRIQENFLPRK